MEIVERKVLDPIHDKNFDRSFNRFSFTGRRPSNLIGYGNRQKYSAIIKQVEQLIVALTDSTGPLEFYTGGVQGFDFIAFWAVDNLKHTVGRFRDAQNVVVIPFVGQERLWSYKGDVFSQEDYHLMLRSATDVVYLKESLPANSGEISKLFCARNQYMVDRSDATISLYNGDDWKVAKGGTTDCMRRAVHHGNFLLQCEYEPVYQYRDLTSACSIEITNTKIVNKKQ